MPSGVYNRKDPEIIDYIVTHASEEISRRQMHETVCTMTDDISWHYLKRLYAKRKLPCKKVMKRHSQLFTEEQMAYLLQIIEGRSSSEVADMMNEHFGLQITSTQIRSWKKNHRMSGGYDTRYRKGRIPDNKGKSWQEWMPQESQEKSRMTCFKEGNIPKNRKPIGTVEIRSDGYLWIKTQDGHRNRNWTEYHRYLWEKEHGPIPKTHKVIFRDGNPLNCQLDNLAMVETKVACIMQTKLKVSKSAEINDAMIELAKLKCAIADKEREKKRRKAGEKND